MKNNIYQADHKFASSKEINTRLESYYRNKFNGVVKIQEEKRKDFQHKGIDKRIFVRDNGSSKIYTVEEKIRRNFYNDFLIELISNDTEKNGSVKNIGWIKKDLDCDFLLFFFFSKNKCFLFNWKVFKKTFEENGKDWIQKAINKENGFKFVEAINKRTKRDGTKIDYKTHNLIVPSKILLSAYKEQFSVS
jgi:hypothetical protein